MIQLRLASNQRQGAHAMSPTPLTVLYFTPSWPPASSNNGIVTYVGNLRPALARLGHRAFVVSMAGASRASDRDVIDVAGFLRTQPIADLVDKVLSRVGCSCNSVRYQARHFAHVVHSITQADPVDLVEIEESFGIAAQLAPRVRVPVVVRLHGPWFLAARALALPEDTTFRWRVAHEGRAIARAAGLSSPSHDTLEQVRRRYGLVLPVAEIIPNAGPDVPAECCWVRQDCEPNTVLFVGRFDRLKGGDLAIQAFHELAKTNPSVRLVFVGPDRGFRDEKHQTIDLATYISVAVPEPTIRSRIEVKGPLRLEAIAELRRRAGVTIVPSRYENFPMTVLEALAHGCPVVAADAGGIPELVRDGDNGRLFRSGDARHLATVVGTLLGDPAAAEAIGQRARAHYLENFAPDVVAEKMVTFYRKVLRRYNS